MQITVVRSGELRGCDIAASAQIRRSAGHQHPQYILAELVRQAQTTEPLSCARELFGIRPGAKSRHEEKDIV